MSPNTTSDELQKRITELERRVGHTGSLWDVATAFIPVWLVVAAIAGFAGFTGWEYYQKSQQELAKTQRLQFEAQIAEVEARATTSVEAPKLKAELGAKQEEARLARVDADAKKQEANGATQQEKKVAAELQNKKAKAAKLKGEADAMTARYGNVGTLEQQAQWWRFVIQELEAAKERSSAGINNGLATNGVRGMFGAQLNAICNGFRFAKEAGCPQQYWPKQSATPQRQEPQAAPAPAKAATNEAASGERFATVITQNLKVRSCASPSCEEVAPPMPQGYRVKIIGEAENGWVKIAVPDEDGETVEGFANGGPKYMRR